MEQELEELKNKGRDLLAEINSHKTANDGLSFK